MGAARTLLKAGLDVMLIEAAPRLGGNCVGEDLHDDSCGRYAVDVGVSDFNRTTFVEFSQLLDELGVETRPIGTGASFATPNGRALCSSHAGQWHFGSGVRDPKRFVDDVNRFRLRATEVLVHERFADWTVARYLDYLDVSSEVRRIYVYSRAMGSFPMPDRSPASYRIRDLIAFWQIHGVVGHQPANRHSVVGGMHRYTEAFRSWFVAAGGSLFAGTGRADDSAPPWRRTDSRRRSRRPVATLRRRSARPSDRPSGCAGASGASVAGRATASLRVSHAASARRGASRRISRGQRPGCARGLQLRRARRALAARASDDHVLPETALGSSRLVTGRFRHDEPARGTTP